MKTLIILILLVVVAVGAFLSRPSQADFATFIKAQNAPAEPTSMKDVGKILLGGFSSETYLQSIVFHDRTLWTSVEQNGQTQYVGVFAHWFKIGANATTNTASPTAR